MKMPQRYASSIYWLSQKAKGRGEIKKRLDYLNKTQTFSPKEIRELQFQKLIEIINYAYMTVPYYKKVFDERGLRPKDIQSFEDIQKLPILTRDKLRTYQKELLSNKADFKTLQTNYSSGSTGVRAEFIQDLNFRMWMRAHQLRTYSWCSDFQLGEPFVLLWGSEIYWSFKQFTDRFDNLLTNRREYNTFNLNNDLIKKFLNELVDYQPKLISTYTNAIYLIAKEAYKHNIKIKGLRAIQTTSEPVPTIMREQIAEIFNCEVYDKYGSRETNIVSHESPSHDGMLIQAENVFVEFINNEGKPCKYGEKGKVVITTLNNFSMPLIRYETSDLAAPIEGNSDTFSGLPRMSPVAGRIQDLIITPLGNHVDAYFFSYLLMRFQEIHWFQVVQKELDKLVFRMFVPNGLSNKTRDELIERVHHHTGYPFKIEFDILNEMPESPTGKFRLCVSELGIPFEKINEEGLKYNVNA